MCYGTPPLDSTEKCHALQVKPRRRRRQGRAWAVVEAFHWRQRWVAYHGRLRERSADVAAAHPQLPWESFRKSMRRAYQKQRLRVETMTPSMQKEDVDAAGSEEHQMDVWGNIHGGLVRYEVVDKSQWRPPASCKKVYSWKWMLVLLALWPMLKQLVTIKTVFVRNRAYEVRGMTSIKELRMEVSWREVPTLFCSVSPSVV